MVHIGTQKTVVTKRVNILYEKDQKQVFLSKPAVIEFMTYLIVFKTGLSGLTMAWYLCRKFRTRTKVGGQGIRKMDIGRGRGFQSQHHRQQNHGGNSAGQQGIKSKLYE